MVSNIKFYSFKKLDAFKRHPFQTLVALVLLFVAVALAPELMGFPIMCTYLASGAISTFIYYRRAAPVVEKVEEEETAAKPSGP